MIKSNLCDFNNMQILVSGNIIIKGEGADDNAKRQDKRNKGVIFKDCAPFYDCISEINNTQINNAKFINVLIPMYNLKQCNDNYSKAGSLWQYYRDDPNDNIAYSESLKLKIKVTEKTSDTGNLKKILKYKCN